jgi:CheY-like chemotaxis protein
MGITLDNTKSKESNKQDGLKRVLIVDDSEMTIALLEAELQGSGLEVLTADSAEVATQIVLKKTTRPHLILLDVNMPNIDGKQFCRFIKNNEQFRDIKVVFCSSMEIEELKEVAATCGADGCVRKDQFLGQGVLSEIE